MIGILIPTSMHHSFPTFFIVSFYRLIIQFYGFTMVVHVCDVVFRVLVISEPGYKINDGLILDTR